MFPACNNQTTNQVAGDWSFMQGAGTNNYAYLYARLFALLEASSLGLGSAANTPATNHWYYKNDNVRLTEFNDALNEFHSGGDYAVLLDGSMTGQLMSANALTALWAITQPYCNVANAYQVRGGQESRPSLARNFVDAMHLCIYSASSNPVPVQVAAGNVVPVNSVWEAINMVRRMTGDNAGYTEAFLACCRRIRFINPAVTMLPTLMEDRFCTRSIRNGANWGILKLLWTMARHDLGGDNPPEMDATLLVCYPAVDPMNHNVPPSRRTHNPPHEMPNDVADIYRMCVLMDSFNSLIRQLTTTEIIYISGVLNAWRYWMPADGGWDVEMHQDGPRQPRSVDGGAFRFFPTLTYDDLSVNTAVPADNMIGQFVLPACAGLSGFWDKLTGASSVRSQVRREFAIRMPGDMFLSRLYYGAVCIRSVADSVTDVCDISANRISSINQGFDTGNTEIDELLGMATQELSMMTPRKFALTLAFEMSNTIGGEMPINPSSMYNFPTHLMPHRDCKTKILHPAIATNFNVRVVGGGYQLSQSLAGSSFWTNNGLVWNRYKTDDVCQTDIMGLYSATAQMNGVVLNYGMRKVLQDPYSNITRQWRAHISECFSGARPCDGFGYWTSGVPAIWWFSTFIPGVQYDLTLPRRGLELSKTNNGRIRDFNFDNRPPVFHVIGNDGVGWVTKTSRYSPCPNYTYVNRRRANIVLPGARLIGGVLTDFLMDIFGTGRISAAVNFATDIKQFYGKGPTINQESSNIVTMEDYGIYGEIKCH
jgi:hypothetical protein